MLTEPSWLGYTDNDICKHRHRDTKTHRDTRIEMQTATHAHTTALIQIPPSYPVVTSLSLCLSLILSLSLSLSLSHSFFSLLYLSFSFSLFLTLSLSLVLSSLLFSSLLFSHLLSSISYSLSLIFFLIISRLCSLFLILSHSLSLSFFLCLRICSYPLGSVWLEPRRCSTATVPRIDDTSINNAANNLCCASSCKPKPVISFRFLGRTVRRSTARVVSCRNRRPVIEWGQSDDQRKAPRPPTASRRCGDSSIPVKTSGVISRSIIVIIIIISSSWSIIRGIVKISSRVRWMTFDLREWTGCSEMSISIHTILVDRWPMWFESFDQFDCLLPVHVPSIV